MLRVQRYANVLKRPNFIVKRISLPILLTLTELLYLSKDFFVYLQHGERAYHYRRAEAATSAEEVPQDNNTHFLRVDGVKQPVAYYSLDVIISIGYRVKSKRGTAFRIWARQNSIFKVTN